MEKLIEKLRELLSDCQVKQNSLNTAITAARSKEFELGELSASLSTRSEALKMAENSLTERQSHVLAGEALILAQEALENEKTAFRVYKDKEEKRLKADEAKNTSELNRLLLLRKKIDALASDELIKRRIAEENLGV